MPNFSRVPTPRPKATLSALRLVGLGACLVFVALLIDYSVQRHIYVWWQDDKYRQITFLLAVPLTLFFMLCTGVILIGSMGKGTQRSVPLVAIGGAIGLTALYGMLLVPAQMVQTGADRLGECAGFYEAARNSNVIPTDSPVLGAVGSSVSCGSQRSGMFLTAHNSVTVWGVNDRGEQDRLLNSLMAYHRQARTHWVQVIFIEKWNMTTTPLSGGARLQTRGPEHVVRVASIG